MKNVQKLLTIFATVGAISTTEILPNQIQLAEAKPISQHIKKGIKNADDYLGGRYEKIRDWSKEKVPKIIKPGNEKIKKFRQKHNF
jgi:hypothetical protein